MDKPDSSFNPGVSMPSRDEPQPALAGTAGPNQPYSRADIRDPQGSSSLGGSTREVGDQARAAARDVARETTQLARSTAESRKGEIADSIQNVARALKSTRSNLGEEEQSALGGYVGQAAERFEQVSAYLRDRDVREMLSDAERTARKEPVLFLGGAFVLGFLGARFLKSSAAAAGSRKDASIGNGAR